MSKHSEACCKLPAVVSGGYSPKGTYTTINGIKTYVTGPSDASKAILIAYDIFGFTDQLVQGADIVAHSDTERSYQVFAPDFFEGDYANMEWFPPDTEDKKAKLGEWFKIAAPPKHLPKIEGILADAQKHNSNIQSWGILGYCWGGKMTSLLGAQDLFKAGVQTSPAMIDPEDAAKVKIPMAMLASEDEPADDVKKYDASLKVKKHVETFDGQPHGFMSAKADLKNPDAKAAYERGYQVAMHFFHENM